MSYRLIGWGESPVTMEAVKSDSQIELAALNGRSNGDSSHQSESIAVPKLVAGQKQSSSKKFKIESVAASDDPLYNRNAASLPRSSNQRRKSQDIFSEQLSTPITFSSRVEDSTRVEPEGLGGEQVFQSVEELTSKPRTFSDNSVGDQTFFSAEDLNKAEKQEDSSPVGVVLRNPSKSNTPSTKSLNSALDEGDTPNSSSQPAKRGRVLSHGHRKDHLKFDDSFCKRATTTVTSRLDTQDGSDQEGVTDIFVPVPTMQGGAVESDMLHETITSAYETNISINKLLKERHKGSLAAMGRFFGNKQKQLEKERSAASLISAVVAEQPKKKKKSCCGRIRPVHVCLIFTAMFIIAAAVVTIEMIELSRETMFSKHGYHFDYKLRELDLYNWELSVHTPVVFKGHMGVNIPGGAPFNCTDASSTSTKEIGCYKWFNSSTLRLSVAQVNAPNFCLDVEWSSDSFHPLLEDCINITDKFGSLYGGHINRGQLVMGDEDLDFISYLPGQGLGNVAERFWMSTKGVAIIARRDIPLHVKVDSAGKKFCLSSWYGHQKGTRKLGYSICRTTNITSARKIALEQYYFTANTTSQVHKELLNAPVFSLSEGDDIEDLKLALSPNATNLNYSYILDTSVKYNLHEDDGLAPFLNKTGVQLTPYAPFTNNITSLPWLYSTDMDVPRLFNVENSPNVLLNSSRENLTTVLDAYDEDFPLVLLTDLASGDIKGQEYYPFSESVHTFQQYIPNTLSLVANSTTGPIMSTVVSASQQSPVVLYLQLGDDLSETIRQVVHSSLAGYSLLNVGEISGNMSTQQFLRTLQLSIFLPTVTFSKTTLAHFFDPKVWDHWQKLLHARRAMNIPKIIEKHARNSQSSYPMYAPPWWYNAELRHLDVGDTFLFDDMFLVAPITNSTSSVRKIFLPPPGPWLLKHITDTPYPTSRSFFHGNQTIRLEAPEDQIMVFEHARGQFHDGWQRGNI